MGWLIKIIKSSSFVLWVLFTSKCDNIIKQEIDSLQLDNDQNTIQLPYARHHNSLLFTNHSWILTIQKDIILLILWKKLLENKEMIFKNYVQAVGCNGAHRRIWYMIFFSSVANVCTHKSRKYRIWKIQTNSNATLERLSPNYASHVHIWI